MERTGKLGETYMYEMNVWTAFKDEGYDGDLNYGEVISFSDGIMQTSNPHEKRYDVTPHNLAAAFVMNKYKSQLDLMWEMCNGKWLGRGHDSWYLKKCWESICVANQNNDESEATKWYDKAREHYEESKSKYLAK